MLVEIVGPIFKCEADENVFLTRISDLPSFEGVAVKGQNLIVSFTNRDMQSVTAELQQICNIWGTTFEVLKQ